jgi:hypothetical protein
MRTRIEQTFKYKIGFINMIKEFMYTSHSGTKLRKVFVLKDTDTSIEGIDLNLLPQDVADFITKTYSDVKPVTDKNAKITLEGFNTIWNKAYRNFSKNKIKD